MTPADDCESSLVTVLVSTVYSHLSPRRSFVVNYTIILIPAIKLAIKEICFKLFIVNSGLTVRLLHARRRGM